MHEISIFLMNALLRDNILCRISVNEIVQARSNTQHMEKVSFFIEHTYFILIFMPPFVRNMDRMSQFICLDYDALKNALNMGIKT